MTDTLTVMTPMQTRRYHHGDLRAALLTRAEETLREKGPAALSLRELARDLDVSHAAPSRHFKDKQALLDALALTGFDRLAETLAASQEDVGETFAERLGAIARAYVDFATANAELLDLMYAKKHDPTASEALVAASQRWGEQLVELIAEGQHRGEVRQGPMERVGLPLFATLHGFASLAVSDMLPAEALEHGLDDVIAHMLRGCAPE
ncbi:TetR family transcriptional regulator [Streptomyces albiflavescens]|uniref:TetR family transcriptional regulator n=2 Tax=Streptomyces albiflavescens TaxID=1623582 RepID=A0A917XTV7_9ACTN|nr:TetR family transcriptional regulator [Streptomyces albiflavescens]